MRRLQVPSLCAGLLFLTAVSYLPVWNNDFVDFDDPLYITKNPRVLEGVSRSGLVWAWTNELAPYGMPLTWLSLQLDASWFSTQTPEGHTYLSPAAVHGQNLLWHGASVLLLFGWWERITGARWCSFLVAALFAVHPMHVESVAWAIERKDVLSCFFGVLTVWAYTYYLQRPSRVRYLGMATIFLLSLLSKPMLMTLPVVLLLLDFWPLGRWGLVRPPPAFAARLPLRPITLRQLVWEKVPLLMLALTMAAATLWAREQHSALVSLNEIPMSARVANALTAYGWYLVTTCWPRRLAILYPHPYGNWSLLSALGGAAVLASITSLCWWQARRRPWLMTGWVWFVVTLMPVIGLAQGGAQAWADRFSYWPHIGLLVAMVWGIAEGVERVRLPARVCALAAALILGGLGALTWVQVTYWQNSLTLWEHALAVTQDNDRAHEHVSRWYREQGCPDAAEAHLVEASRIQMKRMRGATPLRLPEPWLPEPVAPVGPSSGTGPNNDKLTAQDNDGRN
jgi:hypothetical protein